MSPDPPLVDVALEEPVWERSFAVFPLVLVGTLEEDGRPDFAPKHMAMPLSWENHWGFVCAPTHATHRNVKREGCFTVSYPRPEQLLATSFAAAPRRDGGEKPSLSALASDAAIKVTGRVLRGALMQLECELDRIVGDLAENELIIGRVVAARVAEDALRAADGDDADLIARSPLLAYLHPGRWAEISSTQAFPFHRGFSR